MTPAQIHILQHAIGHTREGKPWRNRFVTGPECKDFADCEVLVEAGMMTRRRYPLDEMNTGYGYACTEAGIAAARSHEDIP